MQFNPVTTDIYRLPQGRPMLHLWVALNRSLNMIVKFLDAAPATQQVWIRVASWTKKIFVNSWGPYPTIISHTGSTITRRAYNVPVTPHALVLWANHERLRLKRVEWRQTCHRDLLAEIRQDMGDKVCAEFDAALFDDSDYRWLEVSDSGW